MHFFSRSVTWRRTEGSAINFGDNGERKKAKLSRWRNVGFHSNESMGRKLKFVVKPGKKWENIMNLSLIDCWSTIQGKTLQRSQQTYTWDFNSLFRNMNLAWRFVTMEDKKVCGSTQRIWLTKTYSGFSFYDYRFLGLPDHEFWRANLRTLFSAVWRKDTILTFFFKRFYHWRN